MNRPATHGAPGWRLFYFKAFGHPDFQAHLQAGAPIDFCAVNADTPPDAAEATLRGAHIYQVSSGVNDIPLDFQARASLLERTPELLLVSTIGAGYDTVDVAECTRRGVAVVNQSGGANAQAVVEHTLGMMLALSKRMVEADRHLRRSAGVDRNRFVGRNLAGKTLGILGFGRVGRRLAALCARAFDMEVLVHSAHADAADLAAAGARAVTLDELLATADHVAVCCALTDATRGLMDRRAFARMKPGACFITTARGGIHDEAALLDALQSGHLAGAGIDVWDVEPPPPDHPLLALDKVIATPHTGGATVESREQAAAGAAQQILDALAGVRPPNLLNPDVWPRYLQRLRLARQRGAGPWPGAVPATVGPT